jgi:hypothetical protein
MFMSSFNIVMECGFPGVGGNQRSFYEEFEDTKGVIRIRESTKDRQHNGQKRNGQKDKQRSTKHTYKA